ncbi:putative ribonuclease H-like domain-containing protein [Tanacetum coccineum]
MLKVSPRKSVIRFGKRGKLNPRYIGPFKILDRISPMAYNLSYLKNSVMSTNTFHVSNLKKCLSDESLVIPMKELQLDDKLNFVEEPIEIMDQEVKQLKQSRIPIVKVRWNSKRGPEFTWEREDEIRAKYPQEEVWEDIQVVTGFIGAGKMALWEPWTLFTNGSSCIDGSGAVLILTSLEGTKFTYVLRFQFTASNNGAEYEALIAGLQIATQIGVRNVYVSVDSKLVANQRLGAYVAKENMIKYLEKVKSLVLVEILKEKSIQEKEVTTVVEEDEPTWMTPIMEYLKEGTLPDNRKEANKLRIKARQYELLEEIPYRRSFLKPWLRCVEPLQADYVKGRISGKVKSKQDHWILMMCTLNGSLSISTCFSESQICDKKTPCFFFIDTECLVLSSNFKLLDESQVLLRVPRKDNIYSVDLKSVVPTGGLTCLIAKATIDESNTWHRRLGHINFKTMNKLVKGNLVKGLPSKIFENDHSCVACQKGKQHKASYKTKLVNSISKPLHMLHMDLFGPTNVKSLMKKSYCLVVTDDFSRFSWVFFLATKDETSGILKTFITEIENQLDHKVKVIRSDNGTEFKNSIMNQFCEMKGIKREFSVARTPQQNGVAERKNRTLIEAARTMLVDSKLPTTFWAEAVNTACYVLNRVLVIKPHNKTPYELIRGRPPLIDFMKPFGCPVTILNTRDHLGKFDGKADEGYFVGYSVVSKAMRVFNKRTRIVEETLNIRFLENTPNVKGNGPDWLFDVDSLSISMNYVPVAAGNKTNGIAGITDNIVAGQTEKEKEPKQEYILIPLCTTDPLISQGSKDSEGDAGMKPTEVDENEASDKSRKQDQDARSELERSNQREVQNEHTNSSNGINTVSTLVSTAEPSFDTVVPSTPVNAAGPSVSTANESEEQLFERFSPFKNAFSLPPVLNISMDNTGIFRNAYDDVDVEEAVDMNNTRHMTKITEEHGLFSSVHKLRRTNHKDF